jgi:hypothetical protein
MNKYFVLYVDKNDRSNRHERIQHIGGKYLDGKVWSFTEAKAIDMIERHHKEFFVTVDKETAEVEVAEMNGRKYLKTKQDTDTKDNLLSRPPFPSPQADSIST